MAAEHARRAAAIPRRARADHSARAEPGDRRRRLLRGLRDLGLLLLGLASRPQLSPRGASGRFCAPLRSDYRHLLEIPTRWHDNDVYGHVNNVDYYAFF